MGVFDYMWTKTCERCVGDGSCDWEAGLGVIVDADLLVDHA